MNVVLSISVKIPEKHKEELIQKAIKKYFHEFQSVASIRYFDDERDCNVISLFEMTGSWSSGAGDSHYDD